MKCCDKLTYLFCCLLSIQATAQDVPYIRHFAPNDYRAQNQNWSISQFADPGWMYVANNGGLLEFDGASWRKFTLEHNQAIRSVAIGLDRVIYCGGFATFGCWIPHGGGYQYRDLSKGIASDLFDKEEIWHILPTREGVFFQSFSTLYQYKDSVVRVLKAPGAIMFAQEIEGTIKIPVIGQGIYDLLPNHTFRLLPGTEILSDKIVQFMMAGTAESFWIGTANDGMYEWRDGICKPWNHALNSVFKKNQLNKGIALMHGGWAIGTVLDGVYILDSIAQLRFHLNRGIGLQNNTILSLKEDRDQNLWIGMDKGIDLVSLDASLHYFTDESGQIGTVYTSIEQGNLLYIGTNQGLFARSGAGVFKLVEGTQGQVWDLKIMDNQILCGHNDGTFLIEGMVARKINPITGGWNLIKIPNRTDFLIQSTYTGLVAYHKNSAGQWAFSHKIQGFDLSLRKILFDTLGNLWGVHPNRGLFRVRLSDDLTRISEYNAYTKADGLPSDHLLDMTKISGKLVVNSSNGSVQISQQGDKTWFLPLDKSNNGYKYLAGKDDKIYFLIDSTSVQIKEAGNESRIPIALIPHYENIVALPSQRYLFCLENGFAILDEKHSAATDLSNITNLIPVVRYIEIDGGHFPNVGIPFQFDYRHNTIKIHFAVPYYERQPLFSWYLEGFSEKWSPWQSSPEQVFINLPAGEYVFRVKTDKYDTETFITFTIAPPWYASKWAGCMYFIGFLLFLGGIELLNRHRLTKQRQHLESEKEKEFLHRNTVAEREKLSIEVENKSRELSNAAFNLIRKNEALQSLKDILLTTPNDPNLKQKIVRRIDEHLEGDHDWEIFEEAFNRVHDHFFSRLMRDFPDMTQGDLRLAAYLRMNLSSKDIAPLLNMSLRGVENKRYRLRKKLGLPETDNLAEYLIGF